MTKAALSSCVSDFERAEVPTLDESKLFGSSSWRLSFEAAHIRPENKWRSVLAAALKNEKVVRVVVVNDDEG